MAGPADLELEGSLVEGYLEGRDQAFGALYRRFLPRLVRHLRRITDPQEAEDLAQEVLARALEHLPDFDTRRPLWPWLRTIATNLAIDTAQKRSREVVELPREDAPHWDDHVSLEERPVLARAVEVLNERERNAVRLRDIEEWEMADAAAFLGLSGTAFKQLLYRARQRLRAEYRRLTEGALGTVLVPFRWARRLLGSSLDQLRQVAARVGSKQGVSSESLHQVTVGVAAMVLLISGSSGGGSDTPVSRNWAGSSSEIQPRAGFPVADDPPRPVPDRASNGPSPPSSASPVVSGANRDRPDEARVDEVAGNKIDNLVDPNEETQQPEDTRVVSISSPPSASESADLYAVGTGTCNATLCHSVLFRSSDGGASWTRLPAQGLMADSLLFPPAFDSGDPRLFAMGQDGLLVTEDGGASFHSAAAGGGPQTAGPAAISPGFNSGDPTILIGARTLVRYRDDLKTLEPEFNTAAPSPFDPAYSPAHEDDQTVFLGGVRFDPAWGTTMSTVYRCVEAVCSSADLEGQEVVPEVLVPPDHEETGRVYAFTDWAVFGSSDEGATFTPLTLGWSEEVLSDLTVAGDTLIASTLPKTTDAQGGVYLTTDGGASWKSLDDPLLAKGATTVAVIGSRMIAALGEGGVACSADGGVSWAPRCLE